MRKERDDNGVAPNADAAVGQAAGSSGTPLPAELRERFEGSLGADLSGVRVHTGEASAEANDAVGAKAYATGQDIHFGAGQYDPTSSDGQFLIAHEVAHTVQQQGDAPATQFKLDVSTAGDAHELEADHAAHAMVAGRPADVTTSAGVARSVQRNKLPGSTVEESGPTVPNTMIESEGIKPGAGKGTGMALTFINNGLKAAVDEVQQKAAMSAWYALQPMIFDNLWDLPGQGAEVRFVFAIKQGDISDMTKVFQRIDYNLAPSKAAAGATTEIGALPSGGWSANTFKLWVPPVREVPKDPSKDPKPKDAVEAKSAIEFYLLANAPEPTKMFAKPIDRDQEACEVLQACLSAEVVPNPPFIQGKRLVVTHGKAVTMAHAVWQDVTTTYGAMLQSRFKKQCALLDGSIKSNQKLFDAKKADTSWWEKTAIDLDPHALDRARTHLEKAKADCDGMNVLGAHLELTAGFRQVDLADGQLYHFDEGKPAPGTYGLKTESAE
jgi:hypothetical protein